MNSSVAIRITVGLMLAVVTFTSTDKLAGQDQYFPPPPPPLTEPGILSAFISWLDVGPSEDSSLPGIGSMSEIRISNDNRRIWLGYGQDLNQSYLIQLDSGKFVEYTTKLGEQIESRSARPFARPGHPGRDRVLSLSNSGGSVLQVTSKGFLIKGNRGQLEVVDFEHSRVTPVVQADFSRFEWLEGENVVFRNPNDNLYLIHNLKNGQNMQMPACTDQELIAFRAGGSTLVGAYVYQRGINFHRIDVLGSSRSSALSFGESDDNGARWGKFVNDDHWFIYADPRNREGDGVQWVVIDVESCKEIQRFSAPNHSRCSCQTSLDGKRIVFVSTWLEMGVMVYDVIDNRLELVASKDSHPELSFALNEETRCWNLSEDGALVGFVNQGSGGRAGVLRLEELISNRGAAHTK